MPRESPFHRKTGISIIYKVILTELIITFLLGFTIAYFPFPPYAVCSVGSDSL